MVLKITYILSYSLKASTKLPSLSRPSISLIPGQNDPLLENRSRDIHVRRREEDDEEEEEEETTPRMRSGDKCGRSYASLPLSSLSLLHFN